MSTRRRLLSSAVVVSGGQAAGMAASLGRNVLIARAIGSENFGIALTFLLVVSMLEMLSDLSLDKLLVQARDGDEPRMQAVAQAMSVVRGLLIGLMILSLSPLVADLFDTPQATWAYALVSLVPVIRGFAHLDPRRVQRDLSFTPVTLVESGSQLVALAVAWPIAVWLRDYSAALWVILLQTLAFTLFSHIAAKRRYAWSWDRPTWKRFAVYGWPLMLNGLCAWIGMQGDRFLVGSTMTMADLGVYGAATGLLAAPTTLVLSVMGRLMLPVLSSVQNDPPEFRRRVALTASGYATLVVSGYGFLMFLLVPAMAIYGPGFSIDRTVAVALTVVFALRALRGVPISVALARAQNKAILLGNLARAVAFPLPAALLLYDGSLLMLAIGLGATELVALTAVWSRLLRDGENRAARRRAVAVSASATAILLALGAAAAQPWAGRVEVIVLGCVGSIVLAGPFVLHAKLGGLFERRGAQAEVSGG